MKTAKDQSHEILMKNDPVGYGLFYTLLIEFTKFFETYPYPFYPLKIIL